MLAAAILSAVSNGDRVLAVAPSHAAVDALTMSILSQWPTSIWGDPRRKVVRIGNDLRITVPSVLPFLPQSLDNASLGNKLSYHSSAGVPNLFPSLPP